MKTGKETKNSTAAQFPPFKQYTPQTNALDELQSIKLYRIKGLAAHLSIGKSTIYKMVAAGIFPPPLKIGKSSVWPASVVSNYLASLEVK